MKTPMIAAALAAVSLASAANAQVQPLSNSLPTAVPVTASVPDARDEPWPGTIGLAIDAEDLATGAFRVTETIPVPAGTTRLTLLYPEWLPGDHGPRGPLPQLAALEFQADGLPVAWRRDPVEVFAFHLDLPAGTHIVTAHFTHTSPLKETEGRIVVTREIINLEWEKVSLYPAGHYVRDIRIRPTVTFPGGWSVFTALDGKRADGAATTWDETDYETLVDSPVFAGKYARRLDLGGHVFLDAVADRPEDLVISDDHVGVYRNLVGEAQATFGARHFDHYDLLLGLTDRMSGVGLEHHRSSENQYLPRAWIDWAAYDWDHNVIPHEFVHSWNGKFRRPARLWTPDYRQPMQDDLLWVYEGQTQFWGLVLAARSGIQSRETVLGVLANYAGSFTQFPGRAWRSVEDTTTDPVFAARRPKPFPSLSRNEEYYTEGALVWLEADQIIRDGTAGRRGLDDFAREFFGIRNGDWGVVGYEFGDVVAALNTVYPYDWAGFLKTRIQTSGQPSPLGGIERGGYRLVWKETPNPFDQARMGDGKNLSLNHSIGLIIEKDGKISASRWDGPAVRAGIVAGMQIVAVNGEAYDPEVIKAAITAAKTSGKPIQFLVRRDDFYSTIAVDYRGGLRWPWLEHAGTVKGPTGLDRLLAPHRAISIRQDW